MGQVVHTLPEDKPVHGVASIGDKVYVLRSKGRDQVEVYDANTYRFRRSLTVQDLCGFIDMTSCELHRCMYIANHIADCVHRLNVDGVATRWDVNDKPSGLSVNAAHNVLVTCREVREIKEFSSLGKLLRELTLPGDVINPWHAIQLASGQLIVCHGRLSDAVHRVCKISVDGRDIVHSHGGQRGSDTAQYSVPRHLAVDDNELVLVADVENRRVTLLSPTLDYMRQVVPRDKLKWCPRRLHLDTQRRRLYVVENELKQDKYTAGRVVVFSV